MTKDSLTDLNLTNTAPEKLRDAVRVVIEQQTVDAASSRLNSHDLIGRIPSSAKLKESAEQAILAEPEDARAAEYFQSLIELGYLVASADGLADEERNALAMLVEQVTGSTVDREMLVLHLKDLDDTSEALGRRERLGRVAANFDDADGREEAIGFAALIAIADGKLAVPEMKVLLELGEHLSFSHNDVQSIVDKVKNRIMQALDR